MIPGTPSSFLDSACPGNLDGRLFPLASREWLRPEATASEQLRWYAVYTRSRHEKRIKEQLEGMSFESFLPLYTSIRRWKNGCRTPVQKPLFPGYVFVNIARRECVRVLQVPGVVSIVSAGREPSVLASSDIESLRAALPLCQFEPHPYLILGQKVRVTSGPLAGMVGVLTRKKNHFRVVLTLDLIRQSVAVEMDVDQVEPLKQ